GAARTAKDSPAAPPGPLARLIDARIPWLRTTLETARSHISPVQVVLASCALVLSLFVLGAMIGMPRPISLVAALAVGIGAPALLLSGMVSRRRQKFLEQL